MIATERTVTTGTTAVIDGVQRFPENGIKVVVVGAGVGGLQAALECWRKGCDVVVLERAAQLSPLGTGPENQSLLVHTSRKTNYDTLSGDYFTITPSALTALKEYPSMHADYHQCVYDCSIHVYTPSGMPIHSVDPEWKRPGITHAAPNVDVSFLTRRPVYAQMQLDQVNRLDIPVYWGEKVVSVCEQDDGVTVKTASGKEFTCHLCIGANGIGSVIPGFDTGPETAVQDSGYAAARVAFPRSNIKDGSPASSLMSNIDVRPEFRTYLGSDIHLILFLTPHWVAFAFTHPVSDEESQKRRAGDLGTDLCFPRTTTARRNLGRMSKIRRNSFPTWRRRVTNGIRLCWTSSIPHRQVS
jgi:hypothetical protein